MFLACFARNQKWKRKAKKEGGLGSTLISTGGLTQSVGMSGALMHKSPVELSEKVAQKILALEQAAHNFRVGTVTICIHKDSCCG